MLLLFAFFAVKIIIQGRKITYTHGTSSSNNFYRGEIIWLLSLRNLLFDRGAGGEFVLTRCPYYRQHPRCFVGEF